MEKIWKTLAITAALLTTSIIGCRSVSRVVDSGERGVRVRLGKVSEKQLDEGLNFKAPLIDDFVLYDVRVQKNQAKTKLFSSDVQETTVEYALNWQIDPHQVVEVYRRYGTKKNLENVLLDPAIMAALKDTMGQYQAEKMIEKREQASAQVLSRLQKDMEKAKEPIIIRDFTFKDIDFSDKFEAAVEAKVVAAQEALKEKNIVKQLEAKKEQKIVAAEAAAAETKIQAEAEAEKVRLQAKAEADKVALLAKAEADAITLRGKAMKENPDVLQLEKINRWNGVLPQFITGGSGFLPTMDLKQLLDTPRVIQ